MKTGRGGGATWIVRGDRSRRRRGDNVDRAAQIGPSSRRHSDKGDVLVVQVAGAKDWTLGAAATTLAPGDALWIPAGQPHSARARDDDVSCHLTIHRVTEDHLARRLWDLDDDDNAQFNENSCYIGDRGCDGCNCGSCNLCSDGGAFCTTSADQMTISNPCCEYEENGYYYLGNCDGENSSPVDAWMCAPRRNQPPRCLQMPLGGVAATPRGAGWIFRGSRRGLVSNVAETSI